jgi:polar amino acid transport system substrate-binding protein
VTFAQTSSTLDEVKKRGTLRVGVTQAPPWYSKNPTSGEWATGVGVSLGKAMAASLGVKFEPVEVTWGTAIAALQSNKIDIMYVLDATAERAQAVEFPKSPLLFYSLAVLATDALAVKSWEDLNKAEVKIAVPQATSMDKFLTENVAKAQIQRFPGNSEAIAAFQSGRVDAVCLFHPPLIAARQRLGSGKIVVPTPVQSNPSSAAVRKGDTAFVEWVDKEIAEYYQSRKIQVWYEEFLKDFGLDAKAAPPIVKEML